MSPTTSAGAAPRAPTPIISAVRETVLRTAAKSLPEIHGVIRNMTIHQLARQIQSARACCNFDVETARAMDAWIELYGGAS